MKTLIKNGRIVTAVDDYRADILIEDGTVSLIGKTLDIEADKVIDASGKLVIPGGIDPHTHMDLPFGGTSSSDDFFTGTRAAAFGGTTTIIDFAVQNKGESMLKGVDTWHAKAQGKAVIDYGFHLITTDFEDSHKPEMFRDQRLGRVASCRGLAGLWRRSQNCRPCGTRHALGLSPRRKSLSRTVGEEESRRLSS